MDFFAIADSSRVYRIDMENQIQEQLKRDFLEQANHFLSDELEVVSFTGGNFYPDDTEVLQIDYFDLPDFVLEAIQNGIGCDALSSREDEVASINCVFGYDKGSENLIFQVLPRQQRLTPSRVAILLSGDTFTRIVSPGLIFGSACHAVYKVGNLRFKSMWWVKQAFDISDYYRAATEQDVDLFVEHPQLLIDDVDLLKTRAGQWVRTRIAFILDSGILDRYTPEALAEDAAKFDVPLVAEEDSSDPSIKKLRIPLDALPLRSVLKFLEEEYYEGPITGQKYEANSKRQKIV